MLRYEKPQDRAKCDGACFGRLAWSGCCQEDGVLQLCCALLAEASLSPASAGRDTGSGGTGAGYGAAGRDSLRSWASVTAPLGDLFTCWF